jgi:chromosome segregation protein
MRIKRVEIIGFKSFCDRAVVNIDADITGIVGPNGCGKSNIVDAVRWAMGEQSAKHLRGRSMEDVIFGGSESQPPSGLAEVSLTLQNDRPSEVPPQYRGFSEITIQRRLFRSGESEYRINQATCRLLDITELFLGTGVGTRAYSIIEQGRIGLILNSKPEDRRAIIEEAAGITKYKARKRAAERKMEYTEQNLLRVGDIVGELKKRLDGLERQARKAERYRRLKDELREIELHLAVVRWLELQASSTSLRKELGEISDRERHSSLANAELEGAIAEARQQLAAHGEQLDALASRRHELDKELVQGTQAIEFARRETERLTERTGSLRQELEVLEVRAIWKRSWGWMRPGWEASSFRSSSWPLLRATAAIASSSSGLAQRPRSRETPQLKATSPTWPSVGLSSRVGSVGCKRSSTSSRRCIARPCATRTSMSASWTRPAN